MIFSKNVINLNGVHKWYTMIKGVLCNILCYKSLKQLIKALVVFKQTKISAISDYFHKELETDDRYLKKLYH